MANTQAQFGFKHFGYLPGYAPDYQLTPANISASNATAIGFGDPVIQSTSTANSLIQATLALATAQTLAGIFQGCWYIAANGLPTYSPYCPASTAATAYILNAPGALFLAATLQTAIGSGSIGQAVGFTTGACQTTGGGYSIATLDQSTLATTAGTTASALPFKVVSLYPGVGNGSDPTTSYNWVVVTFNNQIYRTLAAW